MFKKFFFHLSPILVYKVSGNSMVPTYVQGDTVVAIRIWFRLHVNNIIILTHPQTKQLLLKRIRKIEGNLLFVVGDNEKESTDSRAFGWIEKKNVIAKVLWRV